jgi:hypothetical protein
MSDVEPFNMWLLNVNNISYTFLLLLIIELFTACILKQESETDGFICLFVWVFLLVLSWNNL